MRGLVICREFVSDSARNIYQNVYGMSDQPAIHKTGSVLTDTKLALAYFWGKDCLNVMSNELLISLL